jgi:hypothetical protein
MFSLVEDATKGRNGIMYAAYLDENNTLHIRDYKEFNKKFDEI